MSIDYDSIIKKSLEQIFHNIDQERTTVVNAVTGNVDILVKKADEWFGADAPEEYLRVIRSLFTLSTFLVEKQRNNDELSIIKIKDKIKLSLVIKQIIRELMEIFDYGALNIAPDFEGEEPFILTSEQVLKESIYSIFFSLYPFMKKESSCDIKIRKENNNIIAEFHFKKLTESFPGHSEIKKRIFSYNQNNVEKIGIGIDSAINTLRSIGSIIKTDSLSISTLFTMSITFPTVDFMDQVEKIRELNSSKIAAMGKGAVLAIVNDPMMRLLLNDLIGENGYSLNIVSVDDFKSITGLSQYKTLIFDLCSELYSASDLIKKINPDNFNLILIHGAKYVSADDEIFSSFRKFKKPFNVDDIIDYIKSQN